MSQITPKHMLDNNICTRSLECPCKCLINAIDKIAPLITVTPKVKNPKNLASHSNNHKINRRKRLLRSDRINNSTSNFAEIRALNKEIKDHFASINIIICINPWVHTSQVNNIQSFQSFLLIFLMLHASLFTL